MKADLNENAVKAFGMLFAIQHAPRLGLNQTKLRDQELAFACGVALFWLCDDYARHAPNQSGIVAYPQETFKKLSKSVTEYLKKYFPESDIEPKEVLKCLMQGCEKQNIIHKYAPGMYFVDRNFFNYYADAVNTMPPLCYGEC